MTKCYKLDGVVIHIGDWDFVISDEDGEFIVNNPMPEGVEALELHTGIASYTDEEL